MKRHIEYLLVIALLLPMIHDLRTVEDSVCVVADGGQYLDEFTEEATYHAPPENLILNDSTQGYDPASVLDRSSQVPTALQPKARHTLRITPPLRNVDGRCLFHAYLIAMCKKCTLQG